MKILNCLLMSSLLVANTLFAQTPAKDWLITPFTQKSEVKVLQNGNLLEITNGLITRQIRVSPNAATVSFKNLTTNEQFIRSVRPEARVVINGKSYNVGGLYGQKEHGYLLEEWIDNFLLTKSLLLPHLALLKISAMYLQRMY